MNRLLKKRMLIISISLALLLIINIGVSYSYYLGKVVGNESDTTLSLKSAGIIVQYENNSGNIEASNIMPGWNTTKSFNVTSNILETNFTNDQTKLWYEIFLYVEQNDFPSSIMTYTLTPNETIVGNGQVAESRTNAGIETGSNENGISLGLGYFTVGDNRHDYTITFNYVDNGSDYSNYPDSNFLVHIGVKVVVSSSIIIDLDGGTIEGSTTKYVSKGGTVVLPIPKKDGYIFDGWAKMSGDGVVDGNNVTVNGEVLNISAVWRSKAIASVLVLDLDGGTTTQDTINDIKTGEIQTLENPTKDGYLFVGWELVSGEAEISGNKLVAYDESVKIIAIWESVVPDFTYNGKYTLINDTANNWRIKFLTSGTLKFTRLGNAASGIDVFLVGGGGNGGSGSFTEGNYGSASGGGGGYTKTQKAIYVTTTSTYSITIGGSGGNTSAFGYTANAGKNGGDKSAGGAGGSGGGGSSIWNGNGMNGGSDGSNGSTASYGNVTYSGGAGQGSTTREFGESTGTLYAGGGGSGAGGGSPGSSAGAGGAGGGGRGAYYSNGSINATSGSENTGGGGGGASRWGARGSGGSGIVVIRNARG